MRVGIYKIGEALDCFTTETTIEGQTDYREDIFEAVTIENANRVARIFIDRTRINFDNASMLNARICLQSVEYLGVDTIEANVHIDGNYHSDLSIQVGNEYTSIDILEYLKLANSSIMINVLPQEGMHFRFYRNQNVPYIEIEAKTNYNRITKIKDIPLCGGASASVDTLTGDGAIIIPGVYDSKIGIEISQILKKDPKNFNCGKNARLNINESFMKNENLETESKYVYIDGTGNTHLFNEMFYYIDENGDKINVTAQKNNIESQADGKLIISIGGKTYEVTREEKTHTGLRASTRLEGTKNADVFEARSNEEKSLDLRQEELKNLISSCVIADENGNISYAIQNNEVDKQAVENVIDAINNIEEGMLVLSKSEAVSLEMLKINIESVELDTENPDPIMEASIANLENQRAVIIERSQYNSFLLLGACREYIGNLSQKAYFEKQLPVNYLVEENQVKGFNKEGELVVVYGKNGGYVALEYEEYYDGVKLYYRVSKIVNNKGNIMELLYNEENLLSEIVNSDGRRVSYGYDPQKCLSKVQYSNGYYINITYPEGNVRLSDKNNCICEINLAYNTVNSVEIKTTVETIAHGEVQTGEEKTVSKTEFSYNWPVTYVDYENKDRTIYLFNFENENLEMHCEERQGKVYSAQKYVYEAFDSFKTINCKQSALNKNPYHMFLFEEGESKTVFFDQNGRIDMETIQNVVIGSNSDGEIIEGFDIDYYYDGNDRVIKKSYYSRDSLNREKSIVELFAYDTNGRIVRKESYDRKKEAKLGINVEEYIYDSNGRIIKTVKYNSKDPSSKLYLEYEYDENGKIIAKFDESGENKALLIDDTTIYSNGSKLSQCVCPRSGNSAITMSTKDGEENSIQKLYTNGYLTRVVSGDDIYDYSYDYKGRVLSVKYNGTTLKEYEYENDVDTFISRIEVTYANGEYEEYEQTPNHTLRKMTSNGDTKQVEFVLDSGKVISKYLVENNEAQKRVDYLYDGLGRITNANEFWKIDGEQELLSIYGEQYFYNDSNLHKKRINFKNPRILDIDYTYDDELNLSSINCAGLGVAPQKDMLGRNVGRDFSWNNEKFYKEKISYLKYADHATHLPASINYQRKQENGFVGVGGFNYSYDENGNITRVYEDGKLLTEYKYDALGHLVRENNKAFGKTYVFRYDNKGNILSKREYVFTLRNDDYLEEQGSVETKYLYENGRLIKVGDDDIVYDSLGNPTLYKGNTLEWEFGNRLVTYGNTHFTYDAEGKRISKNYSPYVYKDNGEMFTERANELFYIYDHNSSIVAFCYFGQVYTYKKDVFGNVVELLDFQGNTVVKYVYDAWGNHTVTDYTEFGLGNINPIRYRSYYYDIETGLYYLKSRYYDPKTGRFISMDSTDYLDPDTVGGANLYAYCYNNPVMYADPTGKSASVVFLVIGIIATVIIAAGGVVGGVAAYQSGEDVGMGILKGAIGANFISAGISLIASSFYVPGGIFGVLGSSLFGYGAGLILDTLEIAVLQGRKSAMAGDGFWQGTNKVINAITSNWTAIVFGKDNFCNTTVYGTAVFSAIDQSVDFFRYVGNISQYWKYSRAFKIGMSKYWSKNIGKIGIGIEVFSLMKKLYSFAKAFYISPGDSGWILVE